MSTHIEHPLPVPSGSPFTVKNIPFGIFSYPNEQPGPRPGTAIGDYVLDLRALSADAHLKVNDAADSAHVFAQPDLNAFAALDIEDRRRARRAIQDLISDGTSPLYGPLQSKYVISAANVTMHLPMKVGGFTDYLCSLHHMVNAGRLVGQPEPPPSFFHAPVAYNGRASSVLVSGHPIHRPYGMIKDEGGQTVFAPSKRLDYEAEIGVFISKSVPISAKVPASQTEDNIFGFVLLNDWSARDIQFFEMNPLGPFNGKSFGTSITPWIVTMDAMNEAGAVVPVRTEGLRGGKATSLPFLTAARDVSIEITASIIRDGVATKIGKSDLIDMHWSPFQMIAHHTSAGCGLNTGDLIGTGTVSSPAPTSQDSLGTFGCLHELTLSGESPMRLNESDETLKWIEDNDEIALEGWAGAAGSRIGFGSVVARILPALELADI